MQRVECLRAIYPGLQGCVVVTIMGAVAAELHSLGHRENFFYLQHAMGLASSMGLGLALCLPEQRVVVFDGDGSVLMNLGTNSIPWGSATTAGWLDLGSTSGALAPGSDTVSVEVSFNSASSFLPAGTHHGTVYFTNELSGTVQTRTVTLSIGLIANMFTAVLFTRMIFDAMLGRGKVEKLSI